MYNCIFQASKLDESSKSSKESYANIHWFVWVKYLIDLMPVSVEGIMGESSRMTHHLYCIGLRDDLPSLNAQGHSTVS
jgi:hypothetical protein